MHATGPRKTHDAGVVNDDDDDGERTEKIETGPAFAIFKSRVNNCGRSGVVNAAQLNRANRDVDLASC
jgi:hypothetical protein